MSDSHQPGSQVVDLDELDAAFKVSTLDPRPSAQGRWMTVVAGTWPAIAAELRTLRARVASLEMPDTEADRILTMSDEELDAEIRAVGIDPAELDKRASHVAKWAAECSKLRARVGELEDKAAGYLHAFKDGCERSIEAVVALTARAESAEAEVARLRKLFDDAGQGNYNVLALIDHYQSEAMAESERRRVAEARVKELEESVGTQVIRLKIRDNRITDLESQLAAALEERSQVLALLQKAREEHYGTSHYAHHDPKGTAGANCPACHASRRLGEALTAAAAILEVEAKGG